jgi:hypothetical protein
MQTTPGQKVVYPGSPPATQPPPLDGKLCIQGLLQQPSAHPWTESCVPGSPPATQPPPLDGKLCIQDLLQPPSPTPGRKVVYPGSPPATQRPPLDRKLCIQDLLQPPSPHPWTESCVSRISSSHPAPTPGGKVVYPGSPPATQPPPLDRKLCIQDLLQPPSPHPWTGAPCSPKANVGRKRQGEAPSNVLCPSNEGIRRSTHIRPTLASGEHGAPVQRWGLGG